MIEPSADMPQVIELTPAAVQTCAEWAAARGVTPEAMISGCMVAYLLRAGSCGGGIVNIGSLAVTREGIALRIQTVEEFGVFFSSLVSQQQQAYDRMMKEKG